MAKATMQKGPAAIFAAAAYSLLGGCALLPSFDAPIGPSDAAPTVTDLITHIQCEILDVQNLENIDPTDLNKKLIDKFKSDNYIVYASLTLDVVDTQGLTPSLNFIDPFKVAATNLTTTVGGQLSDTQHRNIVQTFTLDLDQKAMNKTLAAQCDSPNETTFGIKGDLGLREIILSGLHHTPSTYIFAVPIDQGSLHVSPSLAPVFGSTVEFTLVYGFNGGPTWTLKHFKGPGGGSMGLVNLMRTEKNTLTISFAAAGAETEKERLLLFPGGVTQTYKSAAAKAAQDNVTRMILQNLIPSP